MPDVKTLIAETYRNLIRQNTVDKITVTDLVNACGISRQTFYYHFQDLLEVIEWSVEHAVQRAVAQGRREEDPMKALSIFVSHVEENRRPLTKLLHSRKRESVERIVVNGIYNWLNELAKAEGLGHRLSQEDYEATLRFSAYGIGGLLLEQCEKPDWDALGLTRRLYRLLSSGLRDIE